jgi:ribosomal protein L5
MDDTLRKAKLAKLNRRLVAFAFPRVRSQDGLLNEHRFRSLGNLVVGNLDRIADVNNIGN